MNWEIFTIFMAAIFGYMLGWYAGRENLMKVILKHVKAVDILPLKKDDDNNKADEGKDEANEEI